MMLSFQVMGTNFKNSRKDFMTSSLDNSVYFYLMLRQEYITPS